ncbi:protein AKNAD1 isoform X3 [Hyla sarda]|uniref:protein AKNAD1 isoform X3 n=1 Tax=Hyla sarda TaxID=327740 RepID=UPI0024C2AC21|nr:protein AKNAD1 isoform X3 [Hyla sarda]
MRRRKNLKQTEPYFSEYNQKEVHSYMECSEDDKNDSQKPLDECRDSQSHLASDTTDDEQEDLPYDGILECYLVPSSQQDEENSPGTPLTSTEESQPANSPIQSTTIPSTSNDNALYSLDSSDLFSLSETISKPITQATEDTEQEYEEFLTIPTIIPDVLLRHITSDNLVNPSEFIDYETIPEISIMESFEETAEGKSDGKLSQCPQEEDEQEGFKEEYLEMYREAGDSIQENVTNGTDSDIDEILGNDEENESELIQKNVEEEEEEERFPLDYVDKERKPSAYEPQRRPSYEMKYGQGQVHYRLPDFSKVAPKVKIPKGDFDAAKPSPTKLSPTVKKTATSTSFIGQSFLIQDILDSMQPGPIKEESLFLDKQRGEVLANSNFNTKVHTESPSSLGCSPSNQTQLRDSGLGISGSEEEVIEELQNVESAREPTEGAKMTGPLMEQAQTLKNKVFHNLKSCLETLEIDYLSTKEKHRILQLQVYRTGSQTVGDFDIERSPNIITVSETQIQDSPVEKEEKAAIDRLHQLYLDPDISIGTKELELDPALSDHSTVHSINQLTRNEASVISNELVPLILGDRVCKPKGPRSLCQVERPEDWILAEESGFVAIGRSTGELKKDTGSSPHLRYLEDEMRKTQRKFRRTQKQMPIFVQEKDADLDLTICNGTQDSLSSDWSVTSHSGLLRCSSNSPINDRTDLYGASSDTLQYRNGRLPRAEKQRNSLNTEMDIQKYQIQKSLWSSKLSLCVQNQSRLSKRQHHIHSSHNVPSSRSSGRSSVSYHSQSTNSTISTLQRKGWKTVSPHHLDYREDKILNYVLDNALRTAKNMQRTSERMVQKLSRDLVNRSPYTMEQNHIYNANELQDDPLY